MSIFKIVKLEARCTVDTPTYKVSKHYVLLASAVRISANNVAESRKRFSA